MLKICCLLLAVVCEVRLAPYDPTVPPGGGGYSTEDQRLEDEWTYDSQELWPQLFEACGGPRQSPTRLDAELLQLGGRPELAFAPGLADGLVHATNTGHTLQLRLSAEAGACTNADTSTGATTCTAGDVGDKAAPLIAISSPHSPLSGTYALEQLHFHWGDSQGSPGSEHELNGQLAEAEAHFVFFNRQYSNISAAAQHSNGLAVIGILLESSEAGQEQEQEELAWPALGLEGRLSQLAEVGSELAVPADLTPLRPLLLQAISKVFSYRGSLTTPPCSPVVCWLVAVRPAVVTGTFLEELSSSLYRDADGRHVLRNNRRYLQIRENRLVIKHIGLN